MSTAAAIKEAWAKTLAAQMAKNAKRAIELGLATLWIQSVWLIRGNPAQPYRLAGYEFMEQIGESKAEDVSIMAASGCGKSEYFMAWSVYQADCGKGVIYAFETDKKTGHLVNERVNPNFERNPYIISRNRGATDNVSFKKLWEGYLYFLGLGSDSVTSTYHGVVLVLDELDNMDGQRVKDMLKRLSAANTPMVRKISNPDQPNNGIHTEWLAGTQHRWNITCDHCKHEAPLDFETHVDKKRAITVCPACSKPIDRLKKGRWIATFPEREKESYHIHRLMVRKCDLKEIIAAQESSDPRTKRASTRFDLGLPFAEKESGLTDEDVQRANGGPEWTDHAPGGFMVVDPGGLFDVQIFQAPGVGVPARCTWLGTVTGFTELAELADRSGVVGGIIDWMPELTGAKDFVQLQLGKGQWWRRCAYKMPDTAGNPAWQPDSTEEDLVAANRTLALDTMVKEFRAGRLVYPARMTQNPDSRFAKHMKAPCRSVEFDKHGKGKVVWDHAATNPDHQFHCTVYATLYMETYKEGSGGTTEVHQSSW